MTLFKYRINTQLIEIFTWTPEDLPLSKVSASFPFCFLAKAFAYGGTSCCQDGMQTKNGKHSEDNYMDKRTPVGVDYVRSNVIIEVRKYEFVIIQKKWRGGKSCK